MFLRKIVLANIMYRISGSSTRNLARGSASLWLQRSSVKYVTSNASSEVEKLNAPESLISNIKEENNVVEAKSTKSNVDIVVARGDCDINQSEPNGNITERIVNGKSTKSDAITSMDCDGDVKEVKDREIELLKMKLRMAEEKNSQMKSSLHDMKVKNTNLQQRIVKLDEEKETGRAVKLLQDSLSSKTNELLLLKEKLDAQGIQYEGCQRELNETKNQLYYKHLALDGIIKSNIKLQERLDVAVTVSVDEKRSSTQHRHTDVSPVLIGHSDVNTSSKSDSMIKMRKIVAYHNQLMAAKQVSIITHNFNSPKREVNSSAQTVLGQKPNNLQKKKKRGNKRRNRNKCFD